MARRMEFAVDTLSILSEKTEPLEIMFSSRFVAASQWLLRERKSMSELQMFMDGSVLISHIRSSSLMTASQSL